MFSFGFDGGFWFCVNFLYTELVGWLVGWSGARYVGTSTQCLLPTDGVALRGKKKGGMHHDHEHDLAGG